VIALGLDDKKKHCVKKVFFSLEEEFVFNIHDAVKAISLAALLAALEDWIERPLSVVARQSDHHH
jgi:hypothetical protein